MRKLFLLGSLLVAAVWYLCGPESFKRVINGLAVSTTRADARSWRLKKVSQAQVSLAFELEKERWLTFELPHEPTALRVVVTADLPEQNRKDFPTPLPEELKWTYAIQYQLVDEQGQVLVERDYHQMTRLSEYHDPEVGETITSTFYLNAQQIPTDSRSLFIRLDEAGVTAVRLRLLSVDRPLSGVSVRVYQPGPDVAHKLRYLWERMPVGRTQKLARGNVFAPELLTAQEKQNLLRHRLTPLAPLGISGRDYRQRELYVLREIEGEAIREEPLAAGLQVDPRRRAVIPLPEEGGQVRLEFRTMHSSVGTRPGQIKLHWQGKKLTQRETFTLPWDGRQASFSKSLQGGNIEVEADEPLVVRAFLPGSKSSGNLFRAEEHEITPELIYTWTYLLEQQAVEFSIQPSAEPTPLRVDLRQVGPVDGNGGPMPAASVSYEMLDAKNNLVHGGILKVAEPVSVYDRLQQHRQEQLVSEAKPSYFAVPPGVVRLRFRAEKNRSRSDRATGPGSPVVVSVFNRPGKLVKVCKVPEDYYCFNRDEVAQRSWFLMRAANHQALEMKNRVPMLLLQSRPSEDEINLLAGIYEWQDHLPGGAWRARPLLVPRDPKAPFRREALAVTFREMRVDRDETVRFQAEPGRQEVTPTLLLTRKEETPLSVRVYLDGRLHHKARILAQRGEVVLPAIRVGAHRVRVSASGPVKAFLNQHDPGAKPAIVKRLAMRLDREGLTFDYDKVSAEEELLSLVLFRPHGTQPRTILAVRIEASREAGPGPYASWTLRQRRYQVRSPQGKPVPVLGTSREVVDEGQTCFFPIGADLPPGRYRLRVDLEEGPGGYVILTRTNPGPYEKRAFFLEHPAG